MIDSLALKIGRTFPLPHASAIAKSLVKPLEEARWACSQSEYASFSMFSSASAFFVAAIAANAFTGNAATSLATALLAGALCFAALRSLPSRVAKKRGEELEAFLPIALRTIASELEARASFESALRSATDCGAFGAELGRALKLIARGHGYDEVFNHLSKQTRSVLVKRALAQLYLTYSRGGPADALRKLADEATAKQRQAIREHSAKTAFFGTVFIAVSAIIPAFFGAYAVISATFLEATFSPGQIIVFFALVFPLMDLAVLAYLKESAPKVLASG